MTATVSAQDEQLGVPGCFAPYHRQPTPIKMLLRPRFPVLYDINWKSSEIFQRTYAQLALVQFQVVLLSLHILSVIKLLSFSSAGQISSEIYCKFVQF